VNVTAVVVSHDHAAELPASLAALLPQVDRAVVIANLPASVASVPAGVELIRNERPLSFAANVNRGIAASEGDAVLVANPDTVAEPGAVMQLVDHLIGHPRCGIVGPQLVNPDGSWQPSKRRFPTVVGTLVRRTPLRLLFPPLERQRRHYDLDSRPSEPVQVDWMLGGFLLLRRQMLEEIGGFDPGFRMYGEDSELAYRAARAGWERWYVPAAVVRHEWDALTDQRFFTRRTLWHWRALLHFVRKHPERLLALR
jgi:GT2 family glycosyltransferase